MLLQRLTALAEITTTVACFAAGAGKKIAELSRGMGGEHERVERLTFPEAIGWFAQRPDDIRIAKGVLLKEPHRRGTLVTWGYLDAAGTLLSGEKGTPYLRRVLAKDLDRELSDYFGEHDLIVLE